MFGLDCISPEAVTLLKRIPLGIQQNTTMLLIMMAVDWEPVLESEALGINPGFDALYWVTLDESLHLRPLIHKMRRLG